MKKTKTNYILISSICVLIGITIIFIINYNVKLEALNCYGLNCSEYIDASDSSYMIKYTYNDPAKKDPADLLYGASCYVECTQQTIPNKCNYVSMAGGMDKPGECTLYDNINKSKHSPNNEIFYMQGLNIPQLPYYDNQVNKEYTSTTMPIKTINDVHKLTCDYDCIYNPLCTSYTTTLADDSLNTGTCKFYSGSNTNDITDMPGTTLHTKNMKKMILH